MSTRVSTKISIRHDVQLEAFLVGVLEQLEPSVSTKGRKIALILHGANGHKDYLFQKRLAQRLPMDSFRFDFRGNHESGGIWRQGNIGDDVEDLRIVVEYLKRTYGYVVDLLVGHSRGSIVSLKWVSSTEDGKNVSGVVNVSGRYRMERIYHMFPADAFDEKGYYTMTVPIARKPTEFTVYPSDLAQFKSWDTSFVWEQFPPAAHVLTLHGLADNVVPPYDGVIYSKALGSRSPGTHNLSLVENADHNFTGRADEVVDTILEWLQLKEQGRLRTGIWQTGVRGKL